MENHEAQEILNRLQFVSGPDVPETATETVTRLMVLGKIILPDFRCSEGVFEPVNDGDKV